MKDAVREDFNAPLGLGPPPATTPPLKRAALLAVALLGVAALGIGARTAWRAANVNARGVAAPIEIAVATPAPPKASPTALTSPDPAPAEGAPDANGVKIIRAGGAGPSGAVIIDIGQALGTKLAPAPDKRLVEKSKDGLLPRIGADGARPFEVYARPAMISDKLKRDAPKLALFVGGVGLNPDLAQAAIKKLPPGVTLGLAPYGADMVQVAAQARDTGHEIWLQAPMEGFGAAQNPGPHTLLASGTAADNLESLHWLMARFTGYVGLANYLGGKFTGDAQALPPVLKDVADRGLAFLDDGSSPRSLVREVAAGMNLPNARADLDLDAEHASKSIEAALTRLEAQARGHGGVIAVATALPDNIDAIARFARELEGRGIALVPVSALLGKGAAPGAGSGQ